MYPPRSTTRTRPPKRRTDTSNRLVGTHFFKPFSTRACWSAQLGLYAPNRRAGFEQTDPTHLRPRSCSPAGRGPRPRSSPPAGSSWRRCGGSFLRLCGLLQSGNIAPVDMAQSTIGPGIKVFSRYARVVEADGSSMPVSAALAIINDVLGEVLDGEEAELDTDTRFALTWFTQHGYSPGPSGDADSVARAKNTSLAGIEASGIGEARAGKFRLYERSELDPGWSPAHDDRLTVWEATQHLAAALERSESEAAELTAHPRRLRRPGPPARLPSLPEGQRQRLGHRRRCLQRPNHRLAQPSHRRRDRRSRSRRPRPADPAVAPDSLLWSPRGSQQPGRA